MTNKRDIFFDLLETLFFVAIFSVSYLLFYNQAFNDAYPSDLRFHIKVIDVIVNGKKFISHPIFHYSTYYLSKALNIDIRIAGVIVNTLLVTILALVIYEILLINSHSDISKYFLLFIVFVVLFSGTFFLPGLGLTRNHFCGNGSIGVWHNVTLYTVKPFAFLCFFTLFHFIENNSAKLRLLFISALAALLSVPAKPSFIIIYLPMLFVLTIYICLNRYKYKYKFSAILGYSCVVLFITSILLIVQYKITYTYGNDNSSVIVAPFQALKQYSDNILVSIIISNIFIITFSFFASKMLSLHSMFSVVLLLLGIIIMTVFAESGHRFSHLNFAWSYLIAQQIAYLSLLIDFINKYSLIKPFSRKVLLLTMALHIVGGVYYFIKVFNGGTYH